MNISQRQATITLLGFQLAALIILWLSQLIADEGTDLLTFGAGLAVVIYGGMLFAYLRGWEYARHTSVVLITLIVAAFLPEPFVTTYAPFLILLGPVLALVLIDPYWVVGSAVATIGLLLLRAGGVGVYANPTTLLNYAMLVAGLVVSRAIAETARTRVKKTEETLQDSQAQLSSIINSAMDAIISIDKSHRIVLFNPAAQVMFVCEQSAAIGQPIEHFLPERFRASHAQHIQRFSQTGVTSRAMSQLGTIYGLRSNGEEFPIEASISQTKAAGQEIFTVILRDITERKQTEQSLQMMHDELELEFQQRTAALSQATALLETMLEYVPDQIYFKDAESRFIKNSRSQAMALGLSDPSLVTGKSDFDFFPHAQRSFDEEQEIIRSGKPLVDFEERVVWPDGKETWVSTSKVPLRNNEGKIIGTFGISRDITERKRAEAALQKAKEELEIRVLERTAELREANQQLQQTQNLAGLGNYFIDLTTGNWKGSDIFDNLLGIDETFERTMETWPTLIHPNDRQKMVDYFTNEVIGKHIRFDKEYRIIRQNDKVERWMHTLGELEVDSRNQPIRMVGTVRDITESKHAKTQIEYQAHLLKEINDAVLATDDQYNITLWNHGAEILYGWSAAEAMGHQTTEIIHSDMTSAEREEILRQLHENGEYHIELTQYRKDGQPVYVSASTVSLYNESKQVTGLLSVNRDITERKQVEEEISLLNENLEERIAERTAQLEAANKELEAFSYSVSHDLRSPLRGIDGWSLALLEDYGGLLDEQGQAHIQRVRAEAQRMGMLIDDILQLSRITRAEMKKENIDLSAIAETVVARIQETKPQDRLVKFSIQKGLTALGDPKLLDVVLTNLIGNSFKFTSKKEEADIEFGQTVVEGEPAFYVRDNGAGFDMAYANKLFGAFQRMHRASEFPGTGVGLATVQRVIHRHGGNIWAASEVGEGSTFYFTLEDNK